MKLRVCDGSHHHLLFFSVVRGYVRRSFFSCSPLLFLSLFSHVFSCRLDIHYLLTTLLLHFLSFSIDKSSLSWPFALSLLLIVKEPCPLSSPFNKLVDTHPLSSLFIHPQVWLSVLRSAVVLAALQEGLTLDLRDEF